jgi:hypothetical protein
MWIYLEKKISLLNGTFRNCLTQKEENARKSLKKKFWYSVFRIPKKDLQFEKSLLHIVKNIVEQISRQISTNFDQNYFLIDGLVNLDKENLWLQSIYLKNDDEVHSSTPPPPPMIYLHTTATRRIGLQTRIFTDVDKWRKSRASTSPPVTASSLGTQPRRSARGRDPLALALPIHINT